MKSQMKKRSFNNLLEFNNEEEEIRHDATMVSLQFVSEINKVLQENGMSNKELASRINVSPSYVSQVFSGNKTAGYEFLAKIQKALGIRFKIHAMAAELAVSGDIKEESGWGEEQINAFSGKKKIRTKSVNL